MELSLFEELAVAGGELALKHFGRVARQLKADRTIVTQADVDVEKLIVDRIRTRFPQHAVLGEESAASSSFSSDYVWAIDPIDGTQGFSFGFPSWAVSIGLLHRGRPAYGAIFLPVIGDLYLAEPGTTYLNGKRLERTPERPIDEHSYVMVPESIHHSYAYDWVGDILSFGAVATHCCYVARGGAVGSVCRPCIWDLAAGVAVMDGVGVVTRYADASEIEWAELFDGSRFRQATIAARPGHWDRLAASFKRRS